MGCHLLASTWTPAQGQGAASATVPSWSQPGVYVCAIPRDYGNRVLWPNVLVVRGCIPATSTDSPLAGALEHPPPPAQGCSSFLRQQ
jgi:hypothetical protein